MEKQKLCAGDFKKYRFLSRLRFSPDSSASALRVSCANAENGYNGNIYVHTEERGIFALTSSGKDKLFVWDSNDTLLFMSERHGNECFYRIKISGGEAVKAFELPVNVGDFEKISDGFYAFTAFVDAGMDDFNNKIASDKMEKEPSYRIIEEIPFWANGEGFTAGKLHRLFIYNEQGDAVTLASPLGADIEDFTVSPRGDFIVYTSRKAGGVMSLKNEMYAYDVKNGATIKLLDNIYSISDFDIWDGGVVFAGSKCEDHGINENHDFYTVSLSGGGERLIAEYDNKTGDPVSGDCRLGGGTGFKACGDTLYFTSVSGYKCDMYALNINSGEIKVIADGGCYDFFDICNGKIQAVAFMDMRLQELYSVSGGKYTLISSFNKDIFDNYYVSIPERHVYKSTDGCEIDGWIMKPVGYVEGKKYPAILNIHGGPKMAFGEIYHHEMQLLANNGYFVLYCNPRGSDGKGDDFADIRGHYGGRDYGDIMGFLDMALELCADIDKQKLGIAGGSYGGFMTNWAIGHTSRFKAAVSQRGISNWISFTYNSDIGYFFGTDQIQADAWKDHGTMWDRSPLKYADKVTTPTLFIHSDNDYRCWIPEGYQMYTALKLHGVESRMCVFHGENHELSRSGKPENRLKRLEEILGWMDKHLKAGQ